MAELGKGPSALRGSLREPPKPIEIVTEEWNGVVEGLEKAKGHWEKMQEVLKAVSRDEVQKAPMQVQKAMGRFRKAKFDVMLERFVAYYRGYGGLEAMKVKKGA